MEDVGFHFDARSVMIGVFDKDGLDLPVREKWKIIHRIVFLPVRAQAGDVIGNAQQICII